MIVNLSAKNSLLHQFLNEIRDENKQKDSLRFRINLERISQILGYELSKELEYEAIQVQTPLGIKDSVQLKDTLVLADILRAGIPMHYGLLQYFDHAENAFISAYRKYSKSGDFEIRLEYAASPNLDGKILVLCDPMIATGASLVATLQQLKKFGEPKKVYVLGIIASVVGLDYLMKNAVVDKVFVADIDDEITAKGYIVPGLGDAGDLAFGPKV
jgi:uracil phosphoribosyltransferase